MTRQAYYKRLAEDSARDRFQEEIVLKLVLEIRAEQPRIGTRKLCVLLRADFRRLGYRLGRDALFEVLRCAELLVKPRRRRVRTTQSEHELRIYPNLVSELKIRRPGQVYVADITYVRLAEEFCYLFLVTDVCTRLIVGWELSLCLEAQCALNALERALKFLPPSRGAIHHSDRGVQYCSKLYASLLVAKKVRISMGAVGAPEDNAIAERVNGILKGEFFLDQVFPSFELAHRATAQTIEIYNLKRPHMSLDYLTPMQRLETLLPARSPTGARIHRSKQDRASVSGFRPNDFDRETKTRRCS